MDNWNDFEPPVDSAFDWIQLDSGEWLKGDLKVMYNQTLEFDSDKMELQLRPQSWLGAGVRGNWSTIDFSDVGGSSEISGLAAFITYTAGF